MDQVGESFQVLDRLSLMEAMGRRATSTVRPGPRYRADPAARLDQAGPGRVAGGRARDRAVPGQSGNPQ